jgi:hypothetical protein
MRIQYWRRYFLFSFALGVQHPAAAAGSEEATGAVDDLQEGDLGEAESKLYSSLQISGTERAPWDPPGAGTRKR